MHVLISTRVKVSVPVRMQVTVGLGHVVVLGAACVVEQMEKPRGALAIHQVAHHLRARVRVGTGAAAATIQASDAAGLQVCMQNGDRGGRCYLGRLVAWGTLLLKNLIGVHSMPSFSYSSCSRLEAKGVMDRLRLRIRFEKIKGRGRDTLSVRERAFQRLEEHTKSREQGESEGELNEDLL